MTALTPSRQTAELVEAGQDVVRASNTLMLMLTGDIALSKLSLETALRRALDARNAWDNAVKDATPSRHNAGSPIPLDGATRTEPGFDGRPAPLAAPAPDTVAGAAK